MKKIFFLTLLFSIMFIAIDDVNAGYVNGYYRNDGAYVQPHYRSNPNGLNYDNYSYRSGDSLYNNSYRKYDTYNWNTPSYNTQRDYYTGYNYYNSYHSNW